MHDLLVINPNAGQSPQAKLWLARLREAGIDARVVDLDANPDALNEAKRLIVAGGDGTVSRYAHACAETGCELGILPAGTGNDFARGLGIPVEPAAACDNIRAGVARAVDLGVLGNEIFLNAAHIGFGSAVSRSVGDDAKGTWGRFAYLRTMIQRLRRARGFHATIKVGSQTLSGRWLQITVANGTSFGGGNDLVEVSPFDGQLDLFAIRPSPIHHLAWAWLLARLTNRVPNSATITRLKGQQIDIDGSNERCVTADGEGMARLPVSFHARPGALRVILPR